MTVTCRICEKTYGDMGIGDKTQGHDCAAGIYRRGDQDYLWCYYGSDFDCNLYKIDTSSDAWKELKNSTDERPIEPVCDLCIKAFAYEGIIELVSEDMPFMDF